MLKLSEASFIQTLNYQDSDYSNWNLYYLHEKWLALCLFKKSKSLYPGICIFIIIILRFIYLFLALLDLCCCAPGFLQLQPEGTTLCCIMWASHCSGFFGCGTQALGMQASVVPEDGLSSCGTWAQLLCSIWDLPCPGIEHMSPAFGRQIPLDHQGSPLPYALNKRSHRMPSLPTAPGKSS